MLWRKFKLDWQYALGELVIVTLGVLVALAINQWNDDTFFNSASLCCLCYFQGDR